MLSRNEFNVLHSVATCSNNKCTQRDLSTKLGLSLGTVNSVLKRLSSDGLIDDMQITKDGLNSLEPYKINNAIIMAAGLSSRFAPISYERPKGVLIVKGEVLIERQIKQLKEASIDDITVVVGYKKEEFFYLGDKYGVDIVVNEQYAERNNNSTIKLVEDRLSNTYICSSDDYFTKNPFEKYAYDSYYSAEYVDGPTDEYCIFTEGKEKRIASVEISGRDAWVMLGHAYWNREFSSTFCRILDEVYDDPETADKLWEDIYIDHIDEFCMVMRPYSPGIIWEFDSLADLQKFDPEFIDNVNSDIMDNICEVLGCTRRDILDFTPISQGLTNLSCSFVVNDKKYVYRHPGVGTEEIIDRKNETIAQNIAKQLGLDNTFVFEDEGSGWKISSYVDNCIPFDYHNASHVARAMQIARTLHQSGFSTPGSFDVYENTQKISKLISMAGSKPITGYFELRDDIETINNIVKAQNVVPVLCHNDFYDPNFLISGDEISLIDWEYSGMSDYASDIGTFLCCSDYTIDEAKNVVEEYFQRVPSADELIHCISYAAICSFYWFTWAIYKDMNGNPVGEWLYLWYKNAKAYSKEALKLAGQNKETKQQSK